MSKIPNKKVKDITGQRFGSWEVLSYSHQSTNKSHSSYWNVLCECGTISKVCGASLRRKKTTKCKSCSSAINGRKGLYSMSEGDPVYFIRVGEYVKIGTSKNIERRRRDIETNNPYKVTLLWVDKELYEEEWHIIFKHRLHRGEWYHMTAGSCEIL